MPRVMLIHWKEEEIPGRATRLRREGHKVEAFFDQGGEGLRELCNKPPKAVVIDLGRLPSHGRAVAVALRQQRGTRHVPIVFVDGDPQKVARVRKELPDATYTNWNHIGPALWRALAKPNVTPVVPNTMAGNSGTPLPKKLGVDGNRSVLLLGAPEGFERKIGATKGDKRIHRNGKSPTDVVMLFVKTVADLQRSLPGAKKLLADGGGLWIAWPKKASGIQTDLGEAIVRKSGLDTGLVDYKVCAIDATWSGLKFARRVAH